MDSDVQALIKCCAGIEETSEKMRQATIEFLWDKYVNQPIRDARKKRLKETYELLERKKTARAASTEKLGTGEGHPQQAQG